MVRAEYLIWIAYSILGGLSMPSFLEVQTAVIIQNLVFALLICKFYRRIISTIIIAISWETKVVFEPLNNLCSLFLI